MLLAAAQASGAETRIALIIGKLNARRLDFYRAVDEFTAKIGRDQHAVGLFYYAGHGVQAEGTNYLIPVDADIQAESDLEANAFDAGRVLRAMKSAQNEMNIVILDACRNNPLPKTRGIERGLARMDAPSGTFIAYAAAPGQSAQDGASGTNGVFTGELVKAMAEPGSSRGRRLPSRAISIFTPALPRAPRCDPVSIPSRLNWRIGNRSRTAGM